MVSMAWMGLAGFAVSAFGLLLQAARLLLMMMEKKSNRFMF
jgi:hypothetical protein